MMAKVGEELQASSDLKTCLKSNEIPLLDPEMSQSMNLGAFSKTEVFMAMVLGHSIRIRALIALLVDQVYRRERRRPCGARTQSCKS